MSFLSRLFSSEKPDPTASFAIPSTPVSLVWDTSTANLNGISPGAPVSALEAFGPCPDVRHISGNTTYYAYPALGVLFEFTRGELEFITLGISEDEYSPLGDSAAPARVTIAPSGELLTADMDASTLTRLLGPFEIMDEDEDELVGVFRMGNLCHEATFAGGPRLVSLVIYNDV